MEKNLGGAFYYEDGMTGERFVEYGLTLGRDGKPTWAYILSDVPDGKGLVPYRAQNGDAGLISRDKIYGMENGQVVPGLTIKQSLNEFIDGIYNAQEQAKAEVTAAEDEAEQLRQRTEAIPNMVGQTVFVHGDGAYEPVQIERITNNGQDVVITGDKEALKGIALAAGLVSPGGQNLELPAASLASMLATNDDGTISTAQPAEAAPQPAAAPEGSLAIDGRPITFIGMDGENAQFSFQDDPDEMIQVMELDEFRNKTGFDPTQPEAPAAMPPESAPEHAPEPEVAATPLPKDKKTGETDWDATLDASAEEFANYLPTILAEIAETYPDPRKSAQRWYQQAGEKIKALNAKIEKATPNDEAKLNKELKAWQNRRKNVEALIFALSPKQEQRPATAPTAQAAEAAETEVEGEAPDIVNDTPDAAQKRGYIMQNGQRIDRSAPDAIIAEGKDTGISFTDQENGVVMGKYGLIEKDRIVPSHINNQENPLHFFAQKWQPKDRTGADSASKIQVMANNLRPELITTGANAYSGAPIVNTRGEVIQGNGRGEALRRAYIQGQAEGYKAWLADNAEDFGLTREQVEQLQNPILVRVLDVDDATAEKLGQYTQSDMESGGDQTFSAKGLAKKLNSNNKLGEFLGYLFAGEPGEDLTFSDYVENNGALALSYLFRNKIINQTEFENATDTTRKGEKKLTEATIKAFRDLSKAPLFLNAPPIIEKVFESLPNNVKLALQKSAYKLSLLDGVVPDIQEAIAYYFDFEADPAFASAKNVESAMAAIADWMNQGSMGSDKTVGELHPNLAARGLAALFKGSKTIKGLDSFFDSLIDVMNATPTMENPEPEGLSREDAYRKLGILPAKEEQPIENNGNGRKGEVQEVPASGDNTGTQGRPGGEGRTEGGSSTSTGSTGTRGRASGRNGNSESGEVKEAPAAESTPAAPANQELTEEEIRNSGYPDEDVIDAAVDYINGDKSFANKSAYNLVKEYVRPQRTTTQPAGEDANGTQLDGPVVQSTGVGAERSGSEAGGLGGRSQEGAAERVPSPENGGVPAGEGGAAETTGVQRQPDVQDTGSNDNRGRNSIGVSGRSNDVGGGQSEAPRVPGEPAQRETETGAGTLASGRPGRTDVGRGVPGPAEQGGQISGGISGREETAAGSTDIEALGGELEDLLKQFGETNLSIDRDINGLDSVSYSTEPEQKKEGALSSKRPKKPTVSLSFEGLTPKQMELAGKIIFTSAKLGYAHAKSEGLTTFNDFARWFKGKFGDAVMKGLNYDESSLDAFIGEVWNTKMKIDGKRLTLEEHASDIRDTELREEGKSTIKERAERQKLANEKKIPFKAANRNNIAEALPQLTPGQWDDVVMIERQFFDPSHNDYDHAYGKGMLITNGTGTGKTYTGLGTIKRFVDQGKGRILLVAPASMTTEWVEKGNAMGIKMRKLANTKDKGEGVVVTSYQNFRENKALYEDTFDLVVYDECHNIIEGQKGEDTLAYEAHKMITNKNVESATERLVANTIPGRRRIELEDEQKALNAESKKPTTKASRQFEISDRLVEIEAEIKQLNTQINALKPTFEEQAKEAAKKTKVLLLSATPFNTIENLKYAEGYIYQYPKVFKSDGTEITDEESRKSAFMTDWFRGDEPMEEREIAFGDHLLDELETVSFRELENGYDNSRDFPDVSGNIMAARFNQAWQSIMKDPRFNALSGTALSLFKNYTWTTQLFETMKISALRDRLQEHLDAGRKIVIFHDRMHESKASDKMPPVGPPFATILDLAMGQENPPIMAIMEFRRQFADILKWEAGLDYRPVQEQVIDFYATDADRARYAKKMDEYNKKLEKWGKECDAYERAHPTMSQEELQANLPRAPKRPQLEAESVATYNGEKTDPEKTRARDSFNDDNSKVKIICVTTASGGAGLSLHDTTGKYPRVMIQTALPNSPIRFIQAEGRIFRWGNLSNAVFEYPRLGLDIEAITFAMSFNAKAETTENLAHGFRGRGLKDSIMTGFYENSGNVPIAGQGIGGVEMDKRGNTLKGMAKAKHDYGVAQRKGIKSGDKSIPEPIGYVMSTWGKMQSGEQALVPFAGRGSIARYMPKGVGVSALEQDIALQADLLVTSASDDFKLREGSFTELNPINKADVVILNGNTDPGMSQIETMEKGFTHLSEGGRLIAVVPNDANAVAASLRKLEGDGALLRSTIIVGNPAIDAGAEGTSRIVIIDKVTKPSMRSQAKAPETHDWSLANKDDLPGLLEPLQIPERIIDKQAIAIKKMKSVLTELRKNKLFREIVVDDEDKPNARITFRMTERFPAGMRESRYRLDALNDKYSYWTGKWFRLTYSDFERVSQNNYLIQAYQWLKEVVGLTDAELRARTYIENTASQESVDAFREMYRQYMKLIRAGFGLSEAQIQRVASGLRPDISAADIDSLNSYGELRAKFEAANHGDDKRQDMYDKVAGVGEKIGLVIGAEAMDRDVLGGYNNVDNTLKVNKNRWNGLSDEKRAQTLLHEFIHSVTVYAIAGYNTNAMGMSDALFDAAKLACDVYEQITKGAPQDVRPFTGQYAIENEKELLAEMANNETKEKLMNRRMWVIRSNRGIRVSGSEMDGAEQTTAWALLDEALDGMLNNFDKALFDRFRGRVSDFIFNIDRNGGFIREADLGATDTRSNGSVTSPVEEVPAFREDPDSARQRQKDNPKKTVKVYKLMRLGEDGKLYPLFIDSSSPIVLGRWYDAESPTLDFLKKMPSGVFLVNPKDGSYTSLEDYQVQHGEKKTKYPSTAAVNDATANGLRWVYIEDTGSGQRRYEGESRRYWNIGINGSGSVSTYAMRPGWHAGSLPTMRQIGKGPKKNLRDDKFVWVEGEVSADVDYNAEAQSNPDNDIPTHIPTDGFYMKSTNANAKAAQADKVGWYVAGSFKANRIISDAEARRVIDEYNAAHPEQEPVQYDYERESGEEFTPSEAINHRITEAELKAVEKMLDDMAFEYNIPIHRISREQMPKGHKNDKGYYQNGEVSVCMDNVADERDAMATVLHESVGHLGLRRLFGDQFRDAMVRIYASLDAKGRQWVNAYIARHPNADNVRAVEEYLSHLAEKADFKTSVWQRIREIFSNVIRKLFGNEHFILTDRELQYILRASYENLKNPNWLNTIEGKAKDILLKRETQVNEASEVSEFDDEPLYRDADSAAATYDAAMKDFRNAAIMEHQNADLPVKIGMEKIMEETGKAKVEENEDYLTRHNLASSRAETQAHEFELFHFKPMLEQVRKIQGTLLNGKSSKDDRQEAYERILDYLYAVSGLERNAYKNEEIELAKQSALAQATTPEQKMKIGLLYESRKRDWSGITSLMGRPASEWREAEADAQAMIDSFKVEVGNDAELDELWNRIRSCTDYNLEHAYKYGLLTREEYERLHGTSSQPRMWEYYLPLRGFSEGTAEEEYSYSNLVHPKSNSVVVKKMNGRWTEADNPLANILNIAETEIVQGNDNWAKQALYRFLLSAGENSLLSQRDAWYVKNPADGTWTLAEPMPNETLEEFEQRMRALRDNIQPNGTKGEPLAKIGRNGLALDKIIANKGNRNEHLIRLKVGGIEKMIWVNGNPAIVKAVTGVGRAQNMKLIRKASRALSNLFTTYSLDFTARNLLRDTIYSRMAISVKEDRAYRSQYKKNWWNNFGYGAFAFPMVRMMAQWESGKLQQKANPTKKERLFMDFMRDGGQTGYTIINSVDQIKKSLERSMRRAGKEVGPVQIPILGHYAQAVKTLNEAFELLTRFTAYQTSRDMRRSGQRSASDAKEISVNFNRKGMQSGEGVWGAVAAYLGATHYFYNAGVQGFDNFLRLFKTKPVTMSVATGAFAVMGVLTPIINAALAGLASGLGDGDDDDKHDWYWNLPEWVRRNNIVLGTGSWYLAIPLPVELRSFYGLGDIAASLMYGKVAARDGFEIGLDAINTAASILPVNPVEGYSASNKNIGDALLRTVAPDATMFFVDWATNRDYTGRPLWKENPFSNTVPKSQGAYASTPKAIVDACQWMAKNIGWDIAPGVVRDALRNYGGGFYRAAEDVSKIWTGISKSDPDRPFRYDDIPFISGFTGHIDQDRSNSFVSNALHEYGNLSEKVVKNLNMAAGTKDITAAMAYEHPDDLPREARVQIILEGEDYILGKMYRDGMNNEYVEKVHLRGKNAGQKYKSKEVKHKGVNALKKEWQDAKERWASLPDKTEDEKSAKAEAKLEVEDAWHKYYSAQADLVDKLMEEEYHHVQRRLQNGIPYEPRPSLSEKVYGGVKDLVK